jgi:gamma-glutamylcysteine synthetase
VKRDGKPIILDDYDEFADYFQEDRATGKTHNGNEVEIEPKKKDIDLHGTCYWYNARLSHYYTVENRLNDQQPPGELSCISALTLGLSEALEEAHEEIMAYSWSELRDGREEACKRGLDGETMSFHLHDFAKRLLEIARRGLERRQMGEEVFLEPLFERLEDDRCPADEAEKCFKKEGINGLVKLRSLRNAEGEKAITERNI